MNRERYTISESDLRYLIREQVEDALNEGFLQKLRNAATTFTGYGGKDTGSYKENLKNRYRAAKENYKEQGYWDKLEKYRTMISQMMKDLNLSPDMTLGQILGQKGRFGKLDGLQRGSNNRMNNNVNGNSQYRWERERNAQA